MPAPPSLVTFAFKCQGPGFTTQGCPQTPEAVFYAAARVREQMARQIDLDEPDLKRAFDVAFPELAARTAEGAAPYAGNGFPRRRVDGFLPH